MTKDKNPYGAPDVGAINQSGDLVGGLLWRAILTIFGLMIAFAILGGLLGWTLGVAAPNYYETVFSNAATRPGFDPTQIGLGLGITQGAVVGLVIGCVAVLSVAIIRSRKKTDTKSN